MSRVARLSDRHEGVCNHGDICCPHYVSGSMVSGSPNTYTNGRPQVRDRDTVTHNCPHCGTGYVTASASSVTVNGRRIARVGDTVVYPAGTGTIISGSTNTFAGE